MCVTLWLFPHHRQKSLTLLLSFALVLLIPTKRLCLWVHSFVCVFFWFLRFRGLDLWVKLKKVVLVTLQYGHTDCLGEDLGCRYFLHLTYATKYQRQSRLDLGDISK